MTVKFHTALHHKSAGNREKKCQNRSSGGKRPTTKTKHHPNYEAQWWDHHHGATLKSLREPTGFKVYQKQCL